MTCDLCGQATATQVITQEQNGQKSTLYRCDACADKQTQSKPKLDRPCVQCKQREGEVKLVRLRPNGRIVTYVCQVCANK